MSRNIITLALMLAVAGCATARAPDTHVEVVDKATPVAEPCPAPETIPALPRRLAAEHPVMPADRDEKDRLFADKILEWIGYGEKADGVLRACARLK